MSIGRITHEIFKHIFKSECGLWPKPTANQILQFVASHVANQSVMFWLMLSHKASCIHFSIQGHSEQVLDYSGFILWYKQAAQIQYL
jgi:hypothetical protein